MNNRRAPSPSHIYTDRASNYNSNTNNNTYNNSSYHNNRRNNNVSRHNNSILPPRSNTPGRNILAEHRSPMRGGYYQPPMHREQSLYYDDMPPPPSQAMLRSQTPIGRPPSRAQSPIPMRSMGGGMVPPSIPNYFSQPSYSNDTTWYYNPPPPPPPAVYRSSSPYHHSGPLQQPPHFVDIPRSQIQYQNQLREENEFLFASTLSEQDNLYGTNMTENLTIEDDHYIRHLLSTGFSEFDALKANFERKLNQPRNNSIRVSYWLLHGDDHDSGYDIVWWW